jgi:hypothetical protein
VNICPPPPLCIGFLATLGVLCWSAEGALDALAAVPGVSDIVLVNDVLPEPAPLLLSLFVSALDDARAMGLSPTTELLLRPNNVRENIVAKLILVAFLSSVKDTRLARFGIGIC